MTSIRIADTARASLEPVNARLAEHYGVLVDLVRRRVGPDHANLFAEPAPVAGADAIAWFVESDGEVQPVEALSPAAAQALRAEAARCMAELGGFAETLERGGPASRDSARLLRDALVTPDEGALWSVDGKPVLVGWGHRRAGEPPSTPGPVFVTAAAGAVPISPAPASRAGLLPAGPTGNASSATSAVTRPPGRAWLPWLGCLLAVLCLALLGERLLRACAIRLDGWPEAIQALLPNACPVAVPAASGPAIAALEADIRQRERDLMGRALSCIAPPALQAPPTGRAEMPVAPSPQAPDPAVPGSDDLKERLETVERGGAFELTLAWEGSGDLDLRVDCPGGDRIAFDRRTACGGALVADLNSNGGASEGRPIEHVIWNAAPGSGTYAVSVNLYRRHGDTRPAIPYRIVLWRNGLQVRQEAGLATTPGVMTRVLTFTSPAGP